MKFNTLLSTSIFCLAFLACSSYAQDTREDIKIRWKIMYNMVDRKRDFRCIAARLAELIPADQYTALKNRLHSLTKAKSRLELFYTKRSEYKDLVKFFGDGEKTHKFLDSLLHRLLSLEFSNSTNGHCPSLEQIKEDIKQQAILHQQKLEKSKEEAVIATTELQKTIAHTLLLFSTLATGALLYHYARR